MSAPRTAHRYPREVREPQDVVAPGSVSHEILTVKVRWAGRFPLQGSRGNHQLLARPDECPAQVVDADQSINEGAWILPRACLLAGDAPDGVSRPHHVGVGRRALRPSCPPLLRG